MRMRRRFPGVENSDFQPTFAATSRSNARAALISSNSHCTKGSFLSGRTGEYAPSNAQRYVYLSPSAWQYASVSKASASLSKTQTFSQTLYLRLNLCILTFLYRQAIEEIQVPATGGIVGLPTEGLVERMEFSTTSLRRYEMYQRSVNFDSPKISDSAMASLDLILPSKRHCSKSSEAIRASVIFRT